MLRQLVGESFIESELRLRIVSAAGSGDSAPPLDARGTEEATSIICEETAKVRDALDFMRGLVDSAKAV